MLYAAYMLFNIKAVYEVEAVTVSLLKLLSYAKKHHFSGHEV